MTFEDIVEKTLGIKKEDMRDDLTPQDVPGWDSMNYLLFIAELESAFGVSFGMNEVMDAKSLGDIRKALEAKRS